MFEPDSDFDFSLSDLAVLTSKVALPNEWEVTFVGVTPDGMEQDYDVVSLLHEPQLGEVGPWYRITEIREIDREGQTATVTFEFT